MSEKSMSEMTLEELHKHAESLGVKTDKGMTKIELINACSMSLKEKAEASAVEKEIAEASLLKEEEKLQEENRQKTLKAAAKKYAIEVGDFKLNPLGLQTIVEFKGSIFMVPGKAQDIKNQIEKRLELVAKEVK